MQKILTFCLIWLLGTSFVSGQDFTVTDATDGGETDVYFRFKTNNRDYGWTILNELSKEGSLEIRLAKDEKFQKSAYSVLEGFPFKVGPGATETIHFSANYNKWIREKTSVSLDIYRIPSINYGGERKRIQRVNFYFTSEGQLQFWNPRYMKLSSWLPPVELSAASRDSREKIVEVRRIGSEPVTARIQVSSDFRNSFRFYTNEINSRRLNTGDTIIIAGGGKSFIIQYNPPAGAEEGWLDTAAVSLVSVANPANRIVFEIKGFAGDGVTGPVTAPTDIDPNSIRLDDEAAPPIMEGIQPINPLENIGKGLSLKDSLERIQYVLDSLRRDSVRKVALPEIQKFLARYRMVDFIHDSVMAEFRLDSGIWSTRIPLELQKVEKGKMGVIPGRMVYNPGEQQIQLTVKEFFYDTLGGHIILAMPSPEYPGPFRDTVPVVLRFVPYYITASKDTFLPDEEEYRIKTETPATVIPPPNTLLYLAIGGGILLLLILFFVRRMLGRPVTDLAYLKELQYQKYRSGADAKNRIEAALVEIDLNRTDMDLVQLEFPGRMLLANVPPPEISRFKKIMRMIFLLGRKTRFLAYYYSFRIDPVYERLPDELILNDEEGLFLLETDMTREILATDHQDFILTDAEINYQIYLDTSEILAFDGPAKIIKVQFTITEEPFEGYSKYQQFILPVKIIPKRVVV